MSNKVVTSSAGGGGGGGIACLRRQFEMRNDAAAAATLEPPTKTAAKPRPTSLFERKTAIFKQSESTETGDRPSPVRPKPKRPVAVSESTVNLSASSPSIPTPPTIPKPTGTKANERAVLDAPGKQEADAAAAAHESICNPAGDSGNPVEVTTSDDRADDVFSPGTAAVSMAAESNDEAAGGGDAVEEDGVGDSAATEEKVDAVDVQDSGSKSASAARSGTVGITDLEESAGKANFKETAAARERRSTDDILSVPCATSLIRVRQVEKSIDNLNSSHDGTSTKDSNPVHRDGGKTNQETIPSVAKTKSTITAVSGTGKPPVAAKKRQPPPVPKKNAKLSETCKSPPDLESEVTPEGVASESVGGQTSPEESQESKCLRPRPNFLLLSTKVFADSVNDDENCKSLPSHVSCKQVLADRGGYHVTPSLQSRTATLFPSGRQKLRPQVSRKINRSADNLLSHDDDGSDASPGLCHRSWTDLPGTLPSQEFHAPSDVDSLNQADSASIGGTPSQVFANQSSNQDPNSDLLETQDAKKTDSPRPHLPSLPNSTIDAEEHEAQDGKSDDFDVGNFLADTFDFLGNAVTLLSPSKENSSSHLQSWTDIWGSSQNLDRGKDQVPGTGKAAKGKATDKRNETIEKRIEADEEFCTGTVRRKTPVSSTRTGKRIVEKSEVKSHELDGSGSRVRERSEEVSDDVTGDVKPTASGVVLRLRGTLSSPLSTTRPSSTTSTNPLSQSSGKRPDSLFSNIPTLPLTFLPPKRPAVPGKYIGGNPVVLLLNGPSVPKAKAEVEKSQLEKEIDVIDSAFEFLDDSGA